MAPITMEKRVTDDLGNAYISAGGPFEIQRDGGCNFVVMTTEDCYRVEAPLSEKEKRSLRSGYEAMLRGDTYDLDDVLTEFESRYGI